MADTPLIQTKYLAIYHNGVNVMEPMEPEKITASCTMTQPPSSTNFMFYGGKDAQIYLTITHDGRLEIGPGLSPTKATQEVAKLLVDMFERELINRKLINR